MHFMMGKCSVVLKFGCHVQFSSPLGQTNHTWILFIMPIMAFSNLFSDFLILSMLRDVRHHWEIKVTVVVVPPVVVVPVVATDCPQIQFPSP